MKKKITLITKDGKQFQACVEYSTANGTFSLESFRQTALLFEGFEPKASKIFSFETEAGKKIQVQAQLIETAIEKQTAEDGTEIPAFVEYSCKVSAPTKAGKAKSWLDAFLFHSSAKKSLAWSVFTEIEALNAEEQAILAGSSEAVVTDAVVAHMNAVNDSFVNSRLRVLAKLQDSITAYNAKNGTANTITDFAHKLEAIQGIPCNLTKSAQ